LTPFWDDRIALWVARQIPGCERGFGPCKAMGVLNRKGDLVAGAVFHNWHPESGVIEMSVVIRDPRAWCRTVMKEAFDYAFKVAGCQMIVARTDPENERALRCWRALGADEYEIPRLRGRNKSEIVSTLTDDAWAASRMNKGQTKAKSFAA
jgi:RimJ/RimL family protein N-acetyltransferase